VWSHLFGLRRILPESPSIYRSFKVLKQDQKQLADPSWIFGFRLDVFIPRLGSTILLSLSLSLFFSPLSLPSLFLSSLSGYLPWLVILFESKHRLFACFAPLCTRRRGFLQIHRHDVPWVVDRLDLSRALMLVVSFQHIHKLQSIYRCPPS